jgi:hypothetical protein
MGIVSEQREWNIVMNGCDTNCGQRHVTRRRVLTAVIALAATGSAVMRAQSRITVPTEVAGIRIPRTRLSLAAAALSQRVGPEFLFNHCMRTFIFGALHARHHGETYDAEPAFMAAAMHDFGLLSAYATTEQSFEVDSANAAEKFAIENGASGEEAKLIWTATVMHDMRWALVSRQGSTVRLVAAGAGADVMGADPGIISVEKTQQILRAFPRLGFKSRFQSLLDDHCRRKPLSQLGTWLDGYCRGIVPNARFPSTAAAINAAPFAD